MSALTNYRCVPANIRAPSVAGSCILCSTHDVGTVFYVIVSKLGLGKPVKRKDGNIVKVNRRDRRNAGIILPLRIDLDCVEWYALMEWTG